MSPSKLKRGRSMISGSIHCPFDLTEDSDIIEFKPRSHKKIKFIDLSEDDIKSDIVPAASEVVAVSRRRAARKVVILEDDSDDEEFAEPTIDQGEIEASSMITRATNRKIKETTRSVISTKSAKKEIDPKALAFVASFASPNRSSATTLTTLPTEILLKIFGSLKKVPAVILGLTCKKLNRIYKDISPFAVGLNQSSDGQRLYMSLRSWVGMDYKYVGTFGIFVTHGHWARFLEERRITAKMLRDMEAEMKSREEAKGALIDKKDLRSSRACVPTDTKEPTRASRLENRLRLMARGRQAENRKRV